MERKTAGDFDQELLNLFDQYAHGDIDRRGFLEPTTTPPRAAGLAWQRTVELLNKNLRGAG